MWTNRIWLGDGFRKTTSNFNYVIIVHEKVFQINLMGTFIFFLFELKNTMFDFLWHWVWHPTFEISLICLENIEAFNKFGESSFYSRWDLWQTDLLTKRALSNRLLELGKNIYTEGSAKPSFWLLHMHKVSILVFDHLMVEGNKNKKRTGRKYLKGYAEVEYIL